MNIDEVTRQVCEYISSLPFADRVRELNKLRAALHTVSPFASEPVDCVLWVKSESIDANDYNPNSVAPPEMELLRLSITQDGYTQPIVAWDKGGAFEVVDGFHRNRVGRECAEVAGRINGYLPLAVINGNRQERRDRIASTIRHNRARGKHAVGAMSDIVIELKRRNWSDSKIGKELGMDPDEVLRLSQISGLAEMFQDNEFSEAWEAADPMAINEDDALDDEVG
jgi:ParB-like chromosome segregation protein Spo0J